MISGVTMNDSWKKNRRVRLSHGLTFILSFLISWTCSIASFASDTTEAETLRKNLFKDSNLPSCQHIQVSPSGVASVNLKFNEFLLKVVNSFKHRSDSTLEGLFHPKLKFNKTYISQIFAKIESTYGPKFDVSVYRLWALNTVDGSPLTLPCQDPAISLHALYGYNLQFAFWIQIMGQELGRIYIPIVFSNGNWYLGGLHAHQWTHEGKNYIDWAQKASQSAEQGNRVGAFFEYDLATKLSFGDRFFLLDEHEKIKASSEKNLSQDLFEKQIKQSLSQYPIEYVSPLFVKGGVGLLLRIRIPKEISLIEIKNRCEKIRETVKTMLWSKNLSGVRCNFLLPSEKALDEGSLGGIFLNL